jgi:hypothetical protein
MRFMSATIVSDTGHLHGQTHSNRSGRADWSDARSECCLQRIGSVVAPAHWEDDRCWLILHLYNDFGRDSATLLTRKHRKCVRAQVNTSSMALRVLGGGTFAEPYATLQGMQAQSLCVPRAIANVSFSLQTSRWIELQCCRPGRQRVGSMVVAAVMVVVVAVVLARVGSDASSRRGDVGRLRRETWRALVFRTVNEVSQRAKDAASAKGDGNKSHRDDGVKRSASKLDEDARLSRAAVRALQRLEQRERHMQYLG